MASIASGQNCFIWDNIYLSQCPCEIILGLVSTEAQTGNYQKKLLIFKCLILDKSGCLSIMLEYRGNPTKSTAIATFPPTVVYLTSSIKRYSSASIVKTAFSSSSGKHWLVPSKHSFVFDSFGRRETLPARHDSNIF